MKLIAFQFGLSEMSESWMFANGQVADKRSIALQFFLLEMANRTVLIDTGCDSMLDFPLLEFRKPAELLKEYGANDITDVILTHSHGDHAGNIGDYPQAEVLLHRLEWQSGQCTLPPIPRLHLYDGDYNFAEHVLLRHIGGHTAGSIVVLINRSKGTYVLCGDECYSMDNLTRHEPTPRSFNEKKSSEFVETYGAPQYIPLISHDPTLVGRIGFRRIF